MVDLTFWPASFRGVPFHVESEGARPGRRLAVHEFPYRDIPFIEDMGAAAVRFPVKAYVASETTLAEAAALEAALGTRGAAPLVLPGRGPVMARLMTCARAMERDKLGYVAFDLEFIAEGASSAVIAITSLISAVTGAGDALSTAAGGLLGRLKL